MKLQLKNLFAVALTSFYLSSAVSGAAAYSFNEIVPDVRQPASVSGGSACPVRSHIRAVTQARAVQWSTALNANPVTILTQDQSADGRLAEIEQVIAQSIAAWSGVNGSALQSVPAVITRTTTQSACGSDGINSICFDQADLAFTPGVLAFTRVITADRIGVHVGVGTPSIEVGEILDADVYFNPSDFQTVFASPAALVANSKAYDLESILTHELGHALGFSHSAIWNAIMFPFAPTAGTFTGTRPSPQQPDASLGEDDRTGLRILYPDGADTVHAGSISGRVTPANPLSLPLSPPGVTGVFGGQVVAIDRESGGVIGSTIAGWSCSGAGPTKFDGSYVLQKLPIDRSYLIYTEPLNGAVDPSQVSNATASLCRNSTTDAGWPLAQSCVVPLVNISFTTRTRPSD